jgi:hypothetical protein
VLQIPQDRSGKEEERIGREEDRTGNRERCLRMLESGSVHIVVHARLDMHYVFPSSFRTVILLAKGVSIWPCDLLTECPEISGVKGAH